MPIIKTVKGDLVKMAAKGEFDFIAHGCNTHCAMGSGIAPQIARTFNGVLQADHDFMGGVMGHSRLGKLSSATNVITDGDGNLMNMTVLNLYTQNFIGCKDKYYPPVSYKAIKECFESMNSGVVEWQNRTHKLARVGIPLIGAGLAGGDWEIIKFLIEKATPDIAITLVEYDPCA